MFELNNKSKEIIENKTGIKFDDIVNMDVEELDRKIEKKINKKLKFSCNYINRFFHFDYKRINKFIDNL